MESPARLVGAELAVGGAESARVAANVGKRDGPELGMPCPRALHTAAVTVSCMLILPVLRVVFWCREMDCGSLR